MRRTRAGFTLVEITIAIVVGVILTSIAIDTFGPARSRMVAGSARQQFVALHAKARAWAIERGTTANFRVDVLGDSAWISADGSRVDGLNFADEMDVDLQSSTSAFQLCMSPRGFADIDCNSFSGSVDLDFVQGGASRSLTIRALGQLEY